MLDAFQKGTERRVDLARVNGRVFVHNASMGLDGEAVIMDPPLLLESWPSALRVRDSRSAGRRGKRLFPPLR